MIRQSSSELRSYVTDRIRKCRDLRSRVLGFDTLSGSRLSGQADAGPSLGLRADRPGNEAAAAIRTHVPEHLFDALIAECAFVTADARIQ
jgi:hypothetical protein